MILWLGRVEFNQPWLAVCDLKKRKMDDKFSEDFWFIDLLSLNEQSVCYKYKLFQVWSWAKIQWLQMFIYDLLWSIYPDVAFRIPAHTNNLSSSNNIPF